MYIADLHNDSLTAVNAERGLVSDYNLSAKRGQLQLFCAYIPFGGRPPEQRRRELMRYANVYFYETDRLDIARITDSHELYDATDCKRRASILSVEGGGGLFADSDELYTLCRAGLRVLGPVWDTNELGCCCYDGDDTGLTGEGKRLIRRCAELGITVDVSHLSDRGFYEVAEQTPLPFIATHSNFRQICRSKRNLTLDMAREIVRRSGVIGLNLYPEFLKDERGATLDDLIRHIDYALEHLGERSIAFGFDIDGTDGKYPLGIDESESIHDKVTDALLKRYPESVVRRIAGENAIDFFLGNL